MLYASALVDSVTVPGPSPRCRPTPALDGNGTSPASGRPRSPASGPHHAVVLLPGPDIIRDTERHRPAPVLHGNGTSDLWSIWSPDLTIQWYYYRIQT